MTVKELREKLSKIPKGAQDAIVRTYDFDFVEITDVLYFDDLPYCREVILKHENW